ncbi:MAG: sigma-70 family RNA polymerase sigma factor [Syntrophomonas sp.]
MLTDEMLAKQTLHGKLSAFEELIERYKNIVFSVVYRILGQYQEAEDVTQEVFITVYEKMYQFDSSRRFGPWINRIAVNTCVTYLRKNRKVITLSFDETAGKQYELPYRVAYTDDPELVFEKAELKQEIDAALMELSESYRLIIIMRFRMELNNQEIAEILGISKENVEVKVHRARKALRKIILRKWKERGLQYELPANK